MNFGQVNSGAKAGFVGAAVSGPLYGLSVLIAGGGDVFDLDIGFDPGLVIGLPFAILFGCVLAGLPGILLGMGLGAWINDRPMTGSVIAASVAAGAVIGVALLQSINETGLTLVIGVRGAIVGALSALVWTRLFNRLRSRQFGEEPEG